MIFPWIIENKISYEILQKGVGEPLRIDECTLRKELEFYARVLVENELIDEVVPCLVTKV